MEDILKDYLKMNGGGMPNMNEMRAKLFQDMLDPSKVEHFSKIAKKSGLDLENFGRKRSREEIINSHNIQVQEINRKFGINNSNKKSYSFKTDFGTNEKKAFSSKFQDLSKFSPIYISKLETGVTHKGRVLYGTVITDSYIIKGISSVMEDEKGDVVNFSLYNAISNSNCYTYSYANEVVKKGSRIAIIEPFFKLRQDGTYGVRIDNPNEYIVIENFKVDKSVDNLKKEGNKFFVANLFDEAIESYTSALALKNADGLYTSCLCNLSINSLKVDSKLPFQALASAHLASLFPNTDSVMKDKIIFRTKSAMEFLPSCSYKSKRDYALMVTRIILNDGDDIVSISNILHNNISASNVDVDLKDMKEKGNELFKSFKFDLSLQKYAVVVSSMKTWIVHILSNRCAALVSQSCHVEAICDAIAAIYVDKYFFKSYYRLAKSLLEIEAYDEAKLSCSYGLKLETDNKELMILKNMIDSSIKKRDGAYDNSSKSSEFKERLSNTKGFINFVAMESDRKVSSINTNNMIEMISNAFPDKVKNLPSWMKPDARIPDYSKEFSLLGAFPKCIDLDRCLRVLAEAYSDDLLIKMQEYSFEIEEDPNNIFKRLGSNHPDGVKWWSNSSFQSILKNKHGWSTHCYDPRMIHCYSNEECRTEILSGGKTHVAIGFVDLGLLREARFSPEPTKESPFVFVGFEASPYSVAKTLIIVSMMKLNVSVDDLIEVWYSSCWSRSTLTNFRLSVQDIIKNDSSLLDSDVLELLNYWNTCTDIPLHTARSKWLDCTLKHHKGFHIGNFKQVEDRIAIGTYFLTGELFPNVNYGSLLMFSFPSSYAAEVDVSDGFLNTIDKVLLWKERLETTDIISAGISHLRKSINVIKNHVINKRILIKLNVQFLGANNDKVCARIKSLNPYSMSWSNISDYISPESFHSMARECSNDDTIHFICSMSWATVVKGASHIDYTNFLEPDIRKNIFKEFKVGFNKIYDLFLELLGIK